MRQVELTAPFGVATARRARRWSLSTPVALRWSAVVLVALLAVLVAIDVQAVRSRTAANRAVSANDLRLLDDAGALYVALAGADATATTVFLRAGIEPAVLRDRYVDQRQEAAARLAALAGGDALDAATRQRIAELTDNLTRYAGLIESTRANTGERSVVGAAYLRTASDLMRDEMLPAATDIYEAAGRRVEAHLVASSSSTASLLIGIAAGVVVLLLVVVQGFLAWRTRRTFNVLLLVATVAVGVAALHRLDDFRDQAARLRVAEQTSAAPMLDLATARILALRARSDSQQALVERFTDPVPEADYDTMLRRLSGLLARADAAGADVARAQTELAVFAALHERISDLDDDGDHQRAVDLAVGPQDGVGRQLDTTLAGLSTASADAFRREVDGARRELGHQAVELVVLAAAAVLIVVGLWRREREYR